jgi:hypothetical protein
MIAAAAHLPVASLRKIYLGDSYGGVITDRVLLAVACCAENLCGIVLSCLSEITDTGIFELASNCPELESIICEGMEVTDAALHTLVRFCGNLKGARFSSCGMSSAGIKALIKGCPRLTHLTVDCDDVGKVAMRKVAKFLPFED